MIPGSANSLLLTAAAGAATGYEIPRSVRFNSADSAYLSKTFSSAGNQKTWTWSAWVKRSELGVDQAIWASVPNSSVYGYFYFLANDTLRFQVRDQTSPSYNSINLTSAVYRDTSAWYHIVVHLDTTQATATNRAKLYVNGVEQVFGQDQRSSIPQNTDAAFNAAEPHAINGDQPFSGSLYFDGYLADIHFIDGQALDPTSFGEFDTNGVWQPKAYTGTYGTNGFHLPFSDNSTAAALGTDTSGNSNTWTVNNILVSSVNYAALSNWSTGNGTVQNPNNAFDGSTATEAKCPYSGTSANDWLQWSYAITASTSLRFYVAGGPIDQLISINGLSAVDPGGSGRWLNLSDVYPGGSPTFPFNFSSIRVTPKNSGRTGRLGAVEVDGVVLVGGNPEGIDSLVDTPTNYGTDTGAGGEVRGNYATLNPLYGGPIPTNGNLDVLLSTQSSYATISFTTGKWYWELTATAAITSGYVGVMDSTYIKTDNTWSSQARSYAANGNKYDGSTSAYGASWANGHVIGVAVDMDAGTIVFYKNGANQGTAFSDLSGKEWRPFVYATTGAYTMNFGQRPFAYTAPSGFKALCTTNLPTPTIEDGSTAMDVVTYTGTGSALTPTSSLNFSPDLIWIKSRSAATDHALYDIVRGTQARLESNNTDAEVTSDGGVTAFNSNGFTLGTLAQVNTSSATYAGWCWDGGSSTVSNSDGTITSSVRANANAGISIIGYTGNGTQGATIGHGLSVAPSLLIFKQRNSSSTATRWWTFHSSVVSPNANWWRNYSALESTTAFQDWGDNTGLAAAPSSTVITVGNYSGINSSSNTFICYAFTPVSGFSSFGSYTGNGSADGPFVYTGFRPRWILLKSTGATYFMLYDTARSSFNVTNTALYPALNNADASEPNNQIDILSNGFKIRGAGGSNPNINPNGTTVVFAAFAEHPFSLARAR